MIPFKDNVPSIKFPFVTISLIVINVAAFIYEFLLGPQLENFLFWFAVIPAKWLVISSSPEITFLGTLGPYLSSIFLHGGWFHLLGSS